MDQFFDLNENFKELVVENNEELNFGKCILIFGHHMK